MATTIRVTKTQRFEDIVALLNGNATKYGTTIKDAEDFINHEVELLAKKNASVDKKKSAEQAKNEVYKSLIVDFLAGVEGAGMTCTDIGKAIDELSSFNTSKMSSLCNSAVKDGTLVKETVKGKTMFRLA